MRFDIITIFPEIFQGALGSGILRRAAQAGLVDIKVVNLRDFAADRAKATVASRHFVFRLLGQDCRLPMKSYHLNFPMAMGQLSCRIKIRENRVIVFLNHSAPKPIMMVLNLTRK